jgi:hypothetical protein
MFRRGGNIEAAVALAAVLALGLAAPAGAAGWGGWGEARDWGGGLLQRALGWLELASNPVLVLKSGQSTSIDPNGCPKTVPKPVLKCDHGSSIDPNGGCPKGTGVRRPSSHTVEDSLSRGQF